MVSVLLIESRYHNIVLSLEAQCRCQDRENLYLHTRVSQKGTEWSDWQLFHLHIYALSGKTSCHQVSKPRDYASKWSYRFEIWQAVTLPRCPSHFRTIGKPNPESHGFDFTRSCGKSSYHLVNRDPGWIAVSTFVQCIPNATKHFGLILHHIYINL